jgi:DNA-binding CsgD family transcriptional regulator
VITTYLLIFFTLFKGFSAKTVFSAYIQMGVCIPSLLIFILFLTHKFTLKQALCTHLVLCNSFNIFQMIFLAYNNEDNLTFVVVHTVIQTVLLFLSLISYLKFYPLFIASSTIISLWICCIITDIPTLNDIFWIIAVFLIIIVLLGNRLVNLINELSHTNKQLVATQYEVFSLLDLDKSALTSLLELAENKKLSSEEINGLMDGLIDKKNMPDIKQHISEWYTHSQNKKNIIAQKLPMLSETQQEICHLILENHSTGNIAKTLGKSPSNITCQRSKIRAKLHLKKEEDLKTVLQERIQKRI